MRKIVLAIALLLTTCYKFAGVDWQKELENTHWAACYTNTDFNSRVSQFNVQGQGYTICNRQLVTITRLNENGLHIMEIKGCYGCHQDGGTLPSILSVIKFKEQSAEQQKH
ncbi:MAG TPA: hypothetical protein VGL27_02865 [Negativicutes bacterium]|jgi:hypothetical protein